ncbi:MAG: Abnormal spindle-like microcephaly-assocd, ASPM-SPD-2-Hydin, partial [Myxococcaceae bacterium]|nr:Abnormal spindle-like microcephaly-assocd, ASPM-SPD-2-Hydin [Myxococcaceae bacterium]
MLRASPRALIAFATVALAVSGCRCNPPPVTARPGEIAIVYVSEGVTVTSATSGTYDFGQVPMGKKVTSKIQIKNTGGGALFLEKLEKNGEGDAVTIGTATVANPVFTVAFEGREIGSGETAEFDLSFDSPTEEKLTVPHEAKLILRATNTEVGKETAEIILKGTSVSGECELPATLDFGAVSRGDQFPLSVKMKNTRPIDAL